jgi:hypothetical protein
VSDSQPSLAVEKPSFLPNNLKKLAASTSSSSDNMSAISPYEIARVFIYLLCFILDLLLLLLFIVDFHRLISQPYAASRESTSVPGRPIGPF